MNNVANHAEAEAHEQAKRKRPETDSSESLGTKDVEAISGAGTEDEGHQPKKTHVHRSSNSAAKPAIEPGSDSMDHDAFQPKKPHVRESGDSATGPAVDSDSEVDYDAFISKLGGSLWSTPKYSTAMKDPEQGCSFVELSTSPVSLS